MHPIYCADALRQCVCEHIDKNYVRLDGCVTDYLPFLRGLITSIDDAQLQQYLCERKRVRAILHDVGFTVAAWQQRQENARLVVANLWHHGKAAATKKLVLEPNENGSFLIPED